VFVHYNWTEKKILTELLDQACMSGYEFFDIYNRLVRTIFDPKTTDGQRIFAPSLQLSQVARFLWEGSHAALPVSLELVCDRARNSMLDVCDLFHLYIFIEYRILNTI
jgi:hypothetical protein